MAAATSKPIAPARNSAGFTLLELTIVIAILAVLMGLAIPRLRDTGTTELRSQAHKMAMTFKLVQSPGGEALADTQWSILTTTGDVVKENAGALPTHILAVGDYAVVAKHGNESYTSKFNVASGQAKQIEVVMESGPASPEALKAIIEPPPPPPTAPVATPGAPGSPNVGMGFVGTNEDSTPRAPGLLPNPGALLRPRLP